MRDTVNNGKQQIAAMTEKHNACCERLEEFQKHLIDRKVHIDVDMWKEISDRLKSIEEYIREHH